MLFLLPPFFVLLWLLLLFFLLGPKVLPEKQVMSVQPYNLSLQKQTVHKRSISDTREEGSSPRIPALSFLLADEGGGGTIILLAPCEVFLCFVML